MRLDFGLGLGGLRNGAGVVSNPVDPGPAHWAAAMFASGSVGFAYDPATPEGLFQDAAGTVAVTADGDPVGRMSDRSGAGYDAVQDNPDRRPIWRTDGSAGWLEFDGIDDEMAVPQAALAQSATGFLAVVELTADGFFPVILGDQSLSTGFTAGFGDSGARIPRFGVSGQNPVVMRAGAAQPIGQRVAMAYVWDGSARFIARDGTELARDIQTDAWVIGDQPLLCYSGSNVLKAPMRFFGGVCVDRGLGGAEMARTAAALGQPLAPTGTSTILSDSTVAAYSGEPSVLSLLGETRNARDLAVPGDNISQQTAAWNAAGVSESSEGYVVIQLGLNDLDPAEGAGPAIARLQTLVDTVRADAGPMPILIAQMTPVRQRLLTHYGAQGDVAQAKWVAINAAIAGQGPNAITGVDARVTAHVAALDDGTGRLAAAYDMGDGIHPNAAGRGVVADAWRDVLTETGLL